MKNVLKFMGVLFVLSLGIFISINSPTFAVNDIQSTNEISSTTTSAAVYIVPDRNLANLGQTFKVDLYVDNTGQDIAAEDITIKFNNKLQILSSDNVNSNIETWAYYLTYPTGSEEDNQVHYLIAGKGKDHLINSNMKVLEMQFVALSTTESAAIYVEDSKITNGVDSENYIPATTTSACANIKIISDVNGDNGYTLLDLGIDALHYGDNPDSEPKYTMDINHDGIIDQYDLDEIMKRIEEK